MACTQYKLDVLMSVNLFSGENTLDDRTSGIGSPSIANNGETIYRSNSNTARATTSEASNTTPVNGLTKGNSLNPNPGHLDNNDSSYVKKELEALEKQQELIDSEAKLLEKKLRIVMREGEYYTLLHRFEI